MSQRLHSEGTGENIPQSQPAPAIRREEDFRALLSATRAILSQPDFEHAARAIFEACKSVTGATAGYIALLSEERDENVLLFADSGGRPCEVDESLRMPVRGMRRAAIETGRPKVQNDFAESEWWSLIPEGHCPLDNVLFVPLMQGDRAVGLLGLANSPGGFAEDDVQVAEAFGELAAVALTHARSLEDLRRYAEKQVALYRVSAAASSMDPAELLNVALHTVVSLFDADAGWITLPASTPEEAPRVAATTGLSPGFIEAVEAVPCERCPLLRSLFSAGAPSPSVHSVEQCEILPRDVLEHERIQAHLTVPLQAEETVLGALHVAWHAGHGHEMDPALALAIGQQVGLALRNAQLYQAALQADHLRTITRLDRALAGSLKPEEVQARSLVLLAEALQARMGVLFVLERWSEDGGSRVFTLNKGWVPMPASRPATSFLTQAISSHGDGRSPVVLHAGDFGPLCPAAHRHVVEGWGPEGLLIPIWAEQRLVAAIVLGGRPADRPLTADDVALAEAAAGSIGQAIGNALLFEAVQRQRNELAALGARLAQVEEAERQRLARDLHDQVGQNLTALGLSLNLARMHLEAGGGDSAQEAITQALAMVEETTESIRSVMAALRPPILDDYGIQAALRWYGERFARQSGLSVEVSAPEFASRLPSTVETAMFRVAQEALNNIAKHACARQVKVTVDRDEIRTRLQIEDDGVGFDPGISRRRSESGGWGLLSMAERAAAVGGTFWVASEPGHGTVITMEIPG